MPTIAEFYGITMMMFYCGKQEVVIEIETLRVMDGKMKPRTLSYIMEWAARHRVELIENWHRARRHEPLTHIIGLDQE